jgi:hypothetical protein
VQARDSRRLATALCDRPLVATNRGSWSKSDEHHKAREGWGTDSHPSVSLTMARVFDVLDQMTTASKPKGWPADVVHISASCVSLVGA